MATPIEVDEKGNLILKLNWRRLLKVFIILIIVYGSWYLPIPGLTLASRISLVIFIGAAGFWVTEAIPPFATAIMVVVLNVYFLGMPSGPLGLAKTGLTDSYQIFINPIASPVLVLFFGGFIMAIAATKHGLDVRIARALIKPFGTRPSMVLFGIISITGLFSMFMSNTATTAMMIALLTPVFKHFEGRPPFKKALVLSVPFAANIGGIGTIIGTPPNGVAVSVLAGAGHNVSFFKWMLVGVPVAAVMLFLLWLILLQIFQPKKEKFELLFPEPIQLTWDLLIVICTFTLTVLLWMTEPLHKIPTAVIALLPIMIFTMFGIIDRNDLKKVEWYVLILIAGGMSLGISMTKTGLSNVLVNHISFLPVPGIVLLVMILFITVLLSNFMSHTSASNIIIPLVISLAPVSPLIAVMGVAFSSSLAMSLPISTPPNAIAFATNEVTTRVMAKYGTIVSLCGLAIVITLLYVFHNFIGLI